jgi:protein-tyrosine phosphatase
MIDLHNHILPGVDDGAADVSVAIAMAKMAVEEGTTDLACTPHILPGLYHNRGNSIQRAVEELRQVLVREDIPLNLVTGADVHLVPDLVAGLREGRLLTLAGSRYVLIEPPRHVYPGRLVDALFGLTVAGYVPILTHPERLAWINTHYAEILRLFDGGVWMQITAASLLGKFGKRAQYWSERMLDEGRVHILASDAHDVTKRPVNLRAGRDAAALRLGEEEAEHLVSTRPRGILANELPSALPMPLADIGGEGSNETGYSNRRVESISAPAHASRRGTLGSAPLDHTIGRLRRFFG